MFGTCKGAFAEYACTVSRYWRSSRQANVTFEQAACVLIAALTALQAFATREKFSQGKWS